jgi:hypothetical protein
VFKRRETFEETKAFKLFEKLYKFMKLHPLLFMKRAL